MNKIFNKRIEIDKKIIWVKVELDTKTGFFYIRFKDDMADTLFHGEGTSGKSLEEVINKFKKEHREYITRKTVRTKVILYKWDNEHSGNFYGTEKTALILSFLIAKETEFNREKIYFDESDHKIHNEYKVMKYTPERELFFVEVRKRMDELINRIDKFFSNENKVIELIDSRQKLLPEIK